MKRLISGFLLICIVFTLISPSMTGVFAATDINASSVFIKQSKSGRCTLASAAMLLRRKALLDGNSYWNSITESAIYSEGWSTGMNWNFTFAGMTLDTTTISGSVSQKKAKIISLLGSHPEGVIIYSYGTGLKTHAVLALDYDSSTDTIYCADPAGGMPSGRIPLTSVYMSGTTQDERIGNIKQYWICTGGTCNLTSPAPATEIKVETETHKHSYTSGYNTNHPHKKYELCSSCSHKYYTGKYQKLSACEKCYPIGSIDVTFSYEKTKGTATFYRNNVQNVHNYEIHLSKDGAEYKTYTMSSKEYKVSELPSGAYTAVLKLVNKDTKQEKEVKFGSFRILETYTVKYNANGGTGAPDSGVKIQNTDFSLSTVIPIRTGYVFKGWSSSKYSTRSKYQPGEKYSKNASVTLYAVWEPEIYNISFDTNGGKGEIESITVTYGDTIKMPNSVIRDNYYLRGWAQTPSASEPEFTFGLDYKPTDNMTLYAVWGKSTWSGDVSDSLSGDGTQENPYKISNAADLAYLAKTVNSQTSAPEYKYYILTDNINLSYVEWVPIGVYGNENQYFCGSFDGNGYTISNLYMTSPNSKYIGLFGYVSGSEIKNINLSGAIEGINSDSELKIGIVAAYGKESSFNNCSVMYCNISNITGTISGYSESSKVGGIIGYLESGSISACNAIDCSINLKYGSFSSGMIAGESSGPISECTVTSAQNGLFSTSDTVSYIRIGGICGILESDAEKCIVESAYFSNTIKSSGNAYIGGIVGSLRYGTVKLSSVRFTNGISKTIDGEDVSSSIYVSVAVGGSVGGIAGSTDNGACISDCKYDGQSVSGISTSGETQVGGLVGQANAKVNSTLSVPGRISLSSENLPKRDGYIAEWYTDETMTTKYDFTNIVTGDITLYAKWSEGDGSPSVWNGTSSEPAYDSTTKTYSITNGEELAWISDVSNGVISSGINFPASRTFSGYTIMIENDIYLNDISNYETDSDLKNEFKCISNNSACQFEGTFEGNRHYIYGLYNYYNTDGGLFGYIGQSGKVYRINLAKGRVYGADYAGAIANYNYGSVRTCNNIDVSVHGGYCGGIVGYNYGDVYYCSNSANVSGTGVIGGIVGKSEGDIYYCYNSGKVDSAIVTGGIVGTMKSGSILYCRNTGSITAGEGGNMAGGIVGGCFGAKVSFDMRFCQNTGRVTAESGYAGGLTGSLWLTGTSRISYCYSSCTLSASTTAGLVANLENVTSTDELILEYNYTNKSTKYNASKFFGILTYKDGNSSMSDTAKFVTNSAIYSKPYIAAMEETYKTYSVIAIEDKDRMDITRAIANVDGVIYGDAKKNAGVGSAIGTGSGNESKSYSAVSKIIAFADKVSSVSSGSSYYANVGYLIGKNTNNVFSFDGTTYYNTDMETSKVNTATAANVALDTTGTARSKNTMKTPFFTTVMGLNPYTTMDNLNTDETAVWVLEDGELPELYYNCLNEIMVSEDIENGTVSTDKTQAVNGEIVTVTATPAEGYALNKVYVNGEEIVGTTFIVSGDADVYATFAKETPVYSVNIEASENASASLTNVDNAEAISLMSTGLHANDGEEIQVSVTAAENYAVNTIYVNGEEIPGDSFIVTKDTMVTMDVADLSTDITAVTNDPEFIGVDMAILSGTVSDGCESSARYIRYWRHDTPDEVFTSDVEVGIGEYNAVVGPLEENTTYCYQMTECGEVKSFSTLQPQYASEVAIEASITSTSCELTDAEYVFTIESAQALEGEMLAIGLYNSDDKLIAAKLFECDGNTIYTHGFSNDLNVSYAKVFVWRGKDSLYPLGFCELVEIN